MLRLRIPVKLQPDGSQSVGSGGLMGLTAPKRRGKHTDKNECGERKTAALSQTLTSPVAGIPCNGTYHDAGVGAAIFLRASSCAASSSRASSLPRAAAICTPPALPGTVTTG